MKLPRIDRILSLSSLLLLTLAAGCGGPGWLGSVQSHGVIRDLQAEAPHPRHLSLDELASDPTMVGVGLLSGPGGDVILQNGQAHCGVIGPDGKPTVEVRTGVGVSHLYGSPVPAWREVRLPRGLNGDRLATEIRRVADANGLEGVSSFPFRVEGRLWGLVARVRMESVSQPEALQRDPRHLEVDRAIGEVVGFYSEAAPNGAGATVTAKVRLTGNHSFLGHVERVSIPVGSTIFLPKR